jgi:hypothetical protein
MAQTIKIKRSTSTSAPSSLAQGELAYSDSSDKLWIGAPADSAVIAIGGKLYTDMLDHTAGTLTASSSIIVDSNSKVDQLKTANLTIGANSITSGSGDIDLVASGNLDIDAGTIDTSSQATEFKIVDNSATSITFTEGTNNYITLVTTNSAEKIIFNKALHFGNVASTGYALPLTDGTSGQALITNGSGAVSFQSISTTLGISGTSGTDTVSLVTDTLAFAGGAGISTAITNNTVTVNAANITLGSSTLTLGSTTTALAGITQLDVDNIRVDTNTISSTNANGDITLAPNGTGTVKVPSGYKDRSGFTTDSLATKEYVDAISQSLDVKASVRVATTANLAGTYNNGNGTITAGSNAAIVIDGVTLSTGNRILVKDQTTATQNGIYTVTTTGDGATAFVITRATDADTNIEITGGTFTFVEEGSTLANNGFVFTHNGSPTLGSTNLTVSQFSGAGQITAGDGLTKSGNTINANPDNITTEISSDTIRIKDISTTAIGDILIGQASDGGYTRLVKPSGNVATSDYLLSMNTSGVASWGNSLDGGTF